MSRPFASLEFRDIRPRVNQDLDAEADVEAERAALQVGNISTLPAVFEGPS